MPEISENDQSLKNVHDLLEHIRDPLWAKGYNASLPNTSCHILRVSAGYHTNVIVLFLFYLSMYCVCVCLIRISLVLYWYSLCCVNVYLSICIISQSDVAF